MKSAISPRATPPSGPSSKRRRRLFSRVNSQLLAQRQAQDEVEARSKLAIARFSREQEFAADQIGIKIIAHAGYDPYGAARFLTALGEWSALRASVSGAGSANRPDMMATHPSTPERVAQATEAARQFGPPGTGETGRNAYLAAIDGLAFGDDPSQGVVRDNAFIHPKLGFAFQGAGRLHARQSVGGADRRRAKRAARRCASTASRSRSRPRSRAPSVRTGSTASRRQRSNPRRSTAWRPPRRSLRATSGVSASGRCA